MRCCGVPLGAAWPPDGWAEAEPGGPRSGCIVLEIFESDPASDVKSSLPRRAHVAALLQNL